MKINKVVLIARQRSGTGYFSTVLNQHPEIFFYPEVFLGRDYEKIYSFYRFYGSVVNKNPGLIAFRERPRVISAYLDHIYSQKAYELWRSEEGNLPGKDLRVIGLDIKYTDFKDEPNLLPLLSRSDVCVVHLVRRNVLKLYISEELNNRKKELNRKAHMNYVPEPVKIKLPVGDELMNHLRVREADIQRFRQALQGSFPALEVHYEDLMGGKNQECQGFSKDELDRLYDFFGLENRSYELETPMRKTNPDRLQDLIENYEEVRETLLSQDIKYSLLLE